MDDSLHEPFFGITCYLRSSQFAIMRRDYSII